MNITDTPSPNFGPRPANADIDMMILHYTGMETAAAALKHMCDPAARVSAHYMIDEDGAITALVDDNDRAWHAGDSYWRGRSDINDHSIGIELVNPGHEFGYRAFGDAQMAALLALAEAIQSRHRIPAANVLGHSDIAPWRKQDPGELFDWRLLAGAGIGLWPDAEGPVEGDIGADAAADAIARLDHIGYRVGANPDNPASAAAVAAFQRHYRPQRIDGGLDAETVALILGLSRLVS